MCPDRGRPVLENRAHTPADTLIVEAERAAQLRREMIRWPSWYLTSRQLCDLEMLACGGFAPLDGFLNRRDYRSVCQAMRLADGGLWPIPVTLDVPDDVLAEARQGHLCLRDAAGIPLAALHITEAWQPDLLSEAQSVFGTTDLAHPGVTHLLRHTNRNYVSGRLEVLQLPPHADFAALRLTPAQVRAEFGRRGWRRVVAFQTRNPMHRAHQQLTLRAARDAGATVLIHPVVGMGKPGDVDVETRVRCYEAILREYPDDTAMLALLPLAMRMAGPREALWHALIRANYGATHFVVGRDHAGPGTDGAGRSFYGPYAAQELLRRHQDEVGIEMVPFKRMVYAPDCDGYVTEDAAPPNGRTFSISGTELRARLHRGEQLPSWFTPPSVATELRRRFPPRLRRGFTVFLTGLSGSGKSTIADVLTAKLRAQEGRYVTALDGDLVRRHLSGGLGFSRAERDANVLRIGFVAAEVTKHGGIAVCAAIAPYDRARQEVREMVQEGGGFILVHVETPLEECERRDIKGLYAKARDGILPQFTGISDPYEVPRDADLRVDTRIESPDRAAEQIIEHLRLLGYLPAGGGRPDGTQCTESRTTGMPPVPSVPSMVVGFAAGVFTPSDELKQGVVVGAGAGDEPGE
ncbi:MAG: bifunctional sulfate adenylyltransferase/adenylylsulfate kinase [Jatrophihabitans sp.]|uniref:bifunctional sulfate adenylyltransferase/adenylylsulfate kinase n=1 Tax=Jatrophihabitans sp. TaxID=1932789 RepID=UPI003912F9B2